MQLKIDHVPPLPALRDAEGRLVPPPFTTQFWNVERDLILDFNQFKLKIAAIDEDEIQMLLYDSHGITSKDGMITPGHKEAMFTLKCGKPYGLYSTANPIVEYWRIILRS